MIRAFLRIWWRTQRQLRVDFSCSGVFFRVCVLNVRPRDARRSDSPAFNMSAQTRKEGPQHPRNRPQHSHAPRLMWLPARLGEAEFAAGAAPKERIPAVHMPGRTRGPSVFWEPDVLQNTKQGRSSRQLLLCFRKHAVFIKNKLFALTWKEFTAVSNE